MRRVLLLALCCVPAATLAADGGAPVVAKQPATSAAAGKDFSEELKVLWRVVACQGEAPLPENIDAKLVEEHCKATRQRMEKYKKTWIAQAMPFLAGLEPKGLPDRVVYPFGGGDLISALTTYPEATTYTTLSLEHGGDPRRILKADKKQLAESLSVLRYITSGLLVANDSKTENLQKGQRGELPSQVCFFLLGLAVHGYEPLTLRYFRFEPDGAVHYYSEQEITEREAKTAQLLHKSWVSPDFSEAFDNVEITFVKKGEDPKKGVKVHRHVAANLANDHLAKAEGLRAYLAKQGRIAAMTKAASYLLWRDNFSLIRDYLLAHMEFMVSDSTGIPPRFATAAGFVQDAYGAFNESFLGASKEHNDAFRKLWREHNKKSKLDFRYGYIDKTYQFHMLVTRKPGPGETSQAEGKPDAGSKAPGKAAPAKPDAGAAKAEPAKPDAGAAK